jgi:hypothetical protein
VRPLDLKPRSSDEYAPVPLSAVAVEARRRARQAIADLVDRRAVSRRDFLVSAAASAAVLSALAACSDEERAARDAPAPGGTFEVPSSTTTAPRAPGVTATTIDVEAATTALDPPAQGDRPAFVVDVQLHFIEPSRTDGGFGGGFPQARCGAADSRDCFAQDVFLDLVFGQSETRVGVLSGLPIPGRETAFSIDVMERARAALEAGGTDRRLLVQAPVFPAAATVPAVLDAMAADADAFPVAAWKAYTTAPAPWRLDDDVGAAVLDQAVALGRPVLAVHKGISGGDPAASPVDVGPAAAAHPGATIVVYHSGWEPGTAEGPYDPARGDGAPSAQQGVDRLIASLQGAGLGPGANVYAELGSTWFNLTRDLDSAAHVLGKLLVHLGPERILWGTDSIWYGSPQGQIDAFRAFSISPAFQERYGYPPLTDDVKALVLGGNAARLYGL